LQGCRWLPGACRQLHPLLAYVFPGCFPDMTVRARGRCPW
jgi:hypothetical protein